MVTRSKVGKCVHNMDHKTKFLLLQLNTEGNVSFSRRYKDFLINNESWYTKTNMLRCETTLITN